MKEYPTDSEFAKWTGLRKEVFRVAPASKDECVLADAAKQEDVTCIKHLIPILLI